MSRRAKGWTPRTPKTVIHELTTPIAATIRII